MKRNFLFRSFDNNSRHALNGSSPSCRFDKCLTRRSKNRRRSHVERLEPRAMLAVNPVISEFQAINGSTVLDEDGDNSDWIELQNPNDQALNLDGWYLTDDATDLRKWEFPSTSVPAGGETLVFASAKDRASGDELHTNFRLSGGGEYLALVEPDGVTVAQDFGADYPEQVEDQSYGLSVTRDTAILVQKTDMQRTWVPTNDALGSEWTQRDFDDTAWNAGTGSIGFEILKEGTNERNEFDTELGPEWTVDIPAGSDSTVSVSGGSLNISIPTAGVDTSSTERGLAPMVMRDLLDDDPTDWEIVTHVIQAEEDDAAAGIVIVDGTTGLPALVFEYNDRRNLQLTDGGETVFDSWRRSNRAEYHLRLVRDGIANTWTAYAKMELADEWREVAQITDGVDDAPVIADPKPGLMARTPKSTMHAQFQFVEINIADQRSVYGPVTGTDVVDSMANVNSSIYMRIPFSVNGNPARFDEMKLATRFDDGFKAYVNGVELTAQNAPIVTTWNSTAAGVHGAVAGRIPSRQVDVSHGISALREGDNVLAIHGMNVAADDPDFFFESSMVASELLSANTRVFTTPTPGKPNQLPSAPVPNITGDDGVFYGSKVIEIDLPNQLPSQQIRFTLDGSEPTMESPLYESPITITESAMLQARTFDTLPISDFEPSNVATGTYFALSDDLRARDSDLPIMIIDTLGQGIPSSGSSDLRPLNVVLFDVDEASGRAAIDNGIVEYLGRGGARDRGSSTSGQAKPNLAFETWGPTGSTQADDFNTGWLGMSPDSDWVLHAPFNFDRALMRNQLAYQLSNEMGAWASDTRVIEVYLNRRDGIVTEDDYAGVYVVIEKIKQGPGRLDIAEIERDDNQAPDVTGGYIWKVDREDPDARQIRAGNQSFNWVFPKSPDSLTASDDQKATLEQQDWVIGHIDEFAATLDAPDINDPDGYSNFINVNSWVDQHLVNVLMLNVDALRLSAYFHKDRNGKLNYGPAWDFDRSAESQDERDDNPFIWRNDSGKDIGSTFFTNGSQQWWGDLFQDPGFWQLYIDRWTAWRQSALSDQNIGLIIDSFADNLRESAARNFERWSNVAPRSTSPYQGHVLDGTYQGEINNLKKWLRERAAFMDSNFAGPARVLVDGIELTESKGLKVTSGQSIELGSELLGFFADDELISTTAGEATATYLVPTNDDLGDTWTQRDFDDTNWMRGPLGFGYGSDDDFGEFIKTQIEPRAVQEGATNILARIEFEVADMAAIEEKPLVIRTRYDDAYIAHLNGTEIYRTNVRSDEITWQARGRSRRNPDAIQFEDVDVSEFKSLLVEGRNVLAVRALNSSPTGNDMFIQPALVSREALFGPSPNSVVYYTLDGSDPRAADGTVGPSAMIFNDGDSISVQENTRLIVRNFDDRDRGWEAGIVLSNWSAPVQYDLEVSTPSLIISELNYNPGEISSVEQASVPDENNDGIPDWTSQDFEFVEIRNSGQNSASLVGVELVDGVEFDFTRSKTTALGAGELGVVVRNRKAFELRYGNTPRVLGEFTGSLNNDGEDIDLISATGEVLFSVNYGDNDPWPVRSDGVGSTLELVDLLTAPEKTSKHYSWRASSTIGGSPGASATPPIGVVINEVLANTGASDDTDSIELFNTTTTTIDIGGWHLSDTPNDFAKFTIPAGTTIAANGYVVLDEADFNANNGFALSANQGDSVWLTIPADDTGIASIVDDVHFRATLDGQALARFPNGQGRLLPAEGSTLGSDNTNLATQAVSISEINYSPGQPSEAAIAIDSSLSSTDLEFVEIQNSTMEAIDLTNWQIRGGAEYDFEDSLMLDAGTLLVVVKFNPESPANSQRLDAFKAHYGINNVRIVGGYNGQLNNSDDHVSLLQPGPSPDNQPNFVPRVLHDEVVYDDLAPWPINADGAGGSLQRVRPDALGSEANSWVAGSPNPGSQLDEGRADFNSDGAVDVLDLDLLLAQLRSVNPDLQFDLNSDGVVTGLDRDQMVQGVLGTSYGDANLDGIFNSRDLVAVFQVAEYEDQLAGNSTWAEGDWDGNGDFDTRDLVLAFQAGSFDRNAIDYVPLDLAVNDLAASIDRSFDVEEDRKEKRNQVVEIAFESPTEFAWL